MSFIRCDPFLFFFFLFKKDINTGKSAYPVKHKWVCTKVYSYSEPGWNSVLWRTVTKVCARIFIPNSLSKWDCQVLFSRMNWVSSFCTELDCTLQLRQAEALIVSIMMISCILGESLNQHILMQLYLILTINVTEAKWSLLVTVRRFCMQMSKTWGS